MSLTEREEQRLRALVGRVEDLERQVNQSVIVKASPTFDGTNFTGIPDEAMDTDYVEVAGDTMTGPLDIIHTSTEADDHALEIDVDAAGFGDVKAIDLDYITGDIAAGEDEGIILININEIAATGGEVFALEVLATDGSAEIFGLKAGALIGPIHQDSGVFANPTTGTDNTPDTDVPAMIDGSTGTTTAIFEADNEYIIIGGVAAFQEIEFILTTTASVNIKPTFWYSTVGTGQFTQFTPVDGTNGFRNTGVVAWDASDLTGHVADTGTGTFDIKIIRTKNNITTSPILGYAKVAATTEYIWDKSGNLTINDITADGNVIIDNPSTEAFLVRKDADGGDVFVVDTTNVMVGVATGDPLATFDVSEGGAVAIMIGADNLAKTRTNAVNKTARIAMPHYLATEEPISLYQGVSNDGYSIATFGGGATGKNAFSFVDFYTGATDTTLVGTRRMRIWPSGLIEIDGDVSIDNTSTEAFLVRKDADGGDIFLVDTTNSQIEVKQLVFIDGGSSVDIIRDEDNMASDDVNALATQQSIKKYVDDNAVGVLENQIFG